MRNPCLTSASFTARLGVVVLVPVDGLHGCREVIDPLRREDDLGAIRASVEAIEAAKMLRREVARVVTPLALALLPDSSRVDGIFLQTNRASACDQCNDRSGLFREATAELPSRRRDVDLRPVYNLQNVSQFRFGST